MTSNIAIFGGSGGIGTAFTKQFTFLNPNATINVFSRQKPKKVLPNVKYHSINYQDEVSIDESAKIASKDSLLDMVIVATGILHEGEIKPEKSIKDLSLEKFQRIFEINSIVPILIAKHLLPKMNRETKSIFAALSARVGSISDNQLGGWYSYRASKAALNMAIKTLALEIRRSNKNAIIIGLHPGTVDTNLSKPFQRNVPTGKLFTPEYSTQKMLEVLKNLTSRQSGKCFAWDGKEILP